MSQTITFRLKKPIYERLDELCRELDRNKSYIIKKALERYLEDYSDYQIALDRLKDKDDKIISFEEMRNRFGL